MFEFLEEIFRKLKPFNCFSRRTQDPERIEPLAGVLCHRQDNLVTFDAGSSTLRQESETPAREESSRTGIDSVKRTCSAPFTDDRITPRRAERQDDAGTEPQTVSKDANGQDMEYPKERVGDEQGRGEAQPGKIGRAVEAIERGQEEPDGGRQPSHDAQLMTDGIFQENFQKENHTNEIAGQPEKGPQSFCMTTNSDGFKHISKSAAAPPTIRISEASSTSFSTSSWPLWEERISPDAGGGTVGASGLSPWDTYEDPSSIHGSASIPPCDHTFLTPSRSASPPRQSLLLWLESSPQQAHAVASMISNQAESPAPSVRLRAQFSMESLRTPSEQSVSSTWEGTIKDMECDSANGGDPIIFQAKLDTAARRDAIAENIVNRLGMNWKPDPDHTTFEVIGEGVQAGTVITPLGYITIRPRVIGRRGRLKLKCYVLADADVGRAFDCLLGCKTTMKHFLALKEDVTNQESLAEDSWEE